MAGVKTGISGQINNNIVTDGLVFYVDPAYKRSYPGSGTTINSLISTNSGSLENGVSFNSGNAGFFQFDGGDDYIDTNFLPPTSDNSRTISLWFKIGSATFKNLFGYGAQASNQAFDICTHPTNPSSGYNVGMHLYGTGVLASTTFTPNVWKNYTITYDGTTLKGYGDGVAANTSTNTVNTSTAMNCLIAKGAYNLTPYSGDMSSILIYDRALSAQEIKQNYQAQKGRFGL